MLYFKSKLIRTSCSDTCNLCGNKLILCKGYKYTSIDKCSNVECISNKFPSSKLYRLGFADDSNTFIKREDQISYWQEHMGHTNINDARAARYDFMLRSLNGGAKIIHERPICMVKRFFNR
ncbi:MAG: hypothetical protein M0R51_05540 [Clostridia bacterium]|jgi:hypothetical protein|nr:hypothetical protein [Clostridia bacterium]